MLWEGVDAERALRERFGFDGLAAVGRWVADVLGRTWGIGVTGCSRVVISGPNAIAWAGSDHGRLVVKWSHERSRFAALEVSTLVLRRLDEQGIPVAAPFAAADGRPRAVVDGPSGPLSVAVLPEVDGTWLDVADETAVRAAGACLARVHAALGTVAPDPAVPVRPQPIEDWIGVWSAHGDHGLAPEASRRLAAMVAVAPELADTPQLVHNDFRAANVLTRGPVVVAVLDLDDVVVDHRVHDLAKACTYLGTRFTDWRPTPAPARRALRAGYESVRPLTAAEARWFDILLVWQGLMAIPGEHDPAGWASAVPVVS
jgi:Ser/Thr protein kinase RdoA (MazF antagonist)